MESSPVTAAPAPRPGSYLARSFARSAAAQAAVAAHAQRVENQQAVKAAAVLRDRAEALRAYILRVRPLQGSSGGARATGSALSFNLANSSATLGSVEEINLDSTASTPRAPLWTGASTSQSGVGGTYDGSLGNTTLTVTVTNAGERGVSNAQVEVTDGASPYKEKININKTDPLGEVYALSNGLELTFGAGTFAEKDTFTVEVQTGSAVRPDPDGTFDGSAGRDVNTEAALPIGAGSFTVNGELITVAANDTINAVIARINASAAGVTALYDAANEIVAVVQDTPGFGPSIVLDNDTSGFLAAMKLDTAVVIPGTSSDLNKPIAEVPLLGGISSGSFLINGTSIAIDVAADSVNAVIDAINSAPAGVTAELVNNSYLSVRQNGFGTLTLDSNGTGFFEAFAITPGLFKPTSTGARPSDYALHEISQQTQGIVRALNRLFEITGSETLVSLRSQVASLVTKELTEPLLALGLSTGFKHDTTDTRPTAFSDVNQSELRRGFRWQLSELTSLFAGSPQAGKRGALQNLINLLENTALAPRPAGALLDETA